jgi:(p)ppGpp synthase/HD superfamily hydrolase
MNRLEQAISVALQAHTGQIDADKLPHIVHAMEVMSRTRASVEETPIPGYTTEEILVAAVLHDVVEDNPRFPLEMIREMFGEKVAEIVDSVTRRKGEHYRDSIYRAKANPGGRLVKVADNGHNRSRLNKISEKKASWRKKLEYKYTVAYGVLNYSHEPTWEGASIEYNDGHYFIADPDGKRIEITEQEAKNVQISFKISN